MKTNNELIGKNFKSVRAHNYTTDRGEDFGEVSGTIISVSGNNFKLKGIMYDFTITKSVFNKYNKFKNN